MSYPDPPPPFHPFTYSPYYDGNGGGFRPQVPMNRDSYPFEQQHPSKRPRNFENNPPNYAPPVPLNSRGNMPIPPRNRGTSRIFYKTRMCLNFMKGNCKNGESCTFAHGSEDLRKPPPNWQEIVNDRGSENSSDRMKICMFYNDEECPYGEKCHFLHESSAKQRNFNDRYDLSSSDAFQVHTNANSDALIVNENINTDGSGAIGNANSDALQASMKTMYRKTKICSKWEVGLCPFADRCHFAHGESDLQVPNERAESIEVTMNAVGSVAENPSPVVTISGVPTNIPVISSNIEEGGEVKKGFTKWGPNKKINKIYGDWIDDLSPPRS